MTSSSCRTPPAPAADRSRASASSASTARCATASACSNTRPARACPRRSWREEFEISRTPVRRVLARLESEGLVGALHGVGTIVTDIEIEELAQVYHLRLELAVLIGRLVADPAHARRPRPHPRPDRPVRRAAARAGDQRAFARLNMEFLRRSAR